MKYVIDFEGTEVVSLICAIERTIENKQKLIKNSSIASMIGFEKNEILRLKNVIKKIKNKKMFL